MRALHLFGFLDFPRWGFLRFLVQAVGANDEGFDGTARIPEGEEAAGVVGRNHAEFVDAVRVGQLLEILNGLAALKLADTGPKFLSGVLLQGFQEAPCFGREYRNDWL